MVALKTCSLVAAAHSMVWKQRNACVWKKKLNEVDLQIWS